MQEIPNPISINPSELTHHLQYYFIGLNPTKTEDVKKSYKNQNTGNFQNP